MRQNLITSYANSPTEVLLSYICCESSTGGRSGGKARYGQAYNQGDNYYG